MRLRCNQEEILELHALGRRTQSQSNAPAVSEEERNRIPQLHAREMNANARPRTYAEGMERSLCGRRKRFGSVAIFRREPALGIEARFAVRGKTMRGGKRAYVRGSLQI
jgi:hypothetical protein